MRKFIILFAVIIGLPIFSIAQVSDSFVLSSKEVTHRQNGSFDELIIEEYSFTDEIGNPQLPVKIVSYVIPYNATVTGIDVTVSQQKLSGNYYIFPAQPPIPLDGSNPPPFVEPNQDIYASSTPYPNKTVEIINDGYTHGYHIVTIKIYPVSYIPANGEIYLQSYNYTINYSTTNIVNAQPAKQSEARAELAKQFVKAQVKNVSDIETCKNNNVQIIPYLNHLNRIDTSQNNSRKPQPSPLQHPL